MARAWVEDMWLTKDAPGTALRALNAARNPLLANVPERYRTKRFGRGKRWRVSYFDDGRKKRAKAFQTKKEAEEFRAALDNDLREGRYKSPQLRTKTFSEAAEEYFSGKQRLKPSSMNAYRKTLRMYVNPMWGDTPLVAIKEQAINDWVTRLRQGTEPYDFHPVKEGGKPRTPKPLSAATIHRIVVSVFGAVMAFAVEREWIDKNPAARIELPRAVSPEKIMLTYGEVEELANAMDRLSDRTLCRFMAYCGTRPGEAMALQIRDVDFDARRAHIRQTWTEPPNSSQQVLGPTKTWGNRIIAFPDFLVPDMQALTEGRSGGEFVFTSVKGAPVTPTNWRKHVFSPAVKAAGIDIPGLSPKALRHTFASLAVASGADVKTIQNQMGHASAAMTLDIYAALWPDRLDDVMTAMSKQRDKSLLEDKNRKFKSI